MEARAKAVFLSYASQDVEAATRLRDGLQAAGIEVWLDQVELQGGDAWDAAIRRRIKDCGLFVPVISPATDARDEGYFRLEWKLAVDRSHLIAEDKAFLLPAVLEGTSQRTARVPERFHDVQWSRASSREEIAAFAQHVLRLQEGAPASRPRAAATRAAMEIEAALADARALSSAWKWREVTAALARAREIAPHNAMVLRALGRHAGHLGRADEAIEYLRQAITLDPLFAANHLDVALLYMCRGRLDEAEAACNQALELDPDGGLAHGRLAMAQLLRGRPERALEAVARETDPVLRMSLTSMGEHTLGQRARSDQALVALIAGHRVNGSFQIAVTCSWRGDIDAAFESLDEACALRDSGLETLLVDPFLAPLRRDHRWGAIVKKVGLPSPL